MPDIVRNNWVRTLPDGAAATVNFTYDNGGGVGAGSNRVLVFAVLGQDGKTITSVFWNTSEAMTLIAGPIMGADRPVWMYYLLNPTSGVHDITVNCSAAFDYISTFAMDLANVRQSAQPDHYATNTSSGTTSLSANIVTVADKCWIVAIGRTSVGGAMTWSGATQLQDAGGIAFADSNGVVTPAGAETITASMGSALVTEIIAVSFAPVDAGAGPGGDVSWLPQITVTNGPAFITVPAGQIPPGS